jgi:hypothetical protein
VSSPVSYLDPAQLQRDLGARDLSEPAEGPHAVQVLIGQAVERLCRAWGCEVRWSSSPRIVPVTDNYDRLGYPAEAITRETPLHPVRGRRDHPAQSFQRHDPPSAAPARPPARRRRAAGLPGDRVPPGRHRLAAHPLDPEAIPALNCRDRAEAVRAPRPLPDHRPRLDRGRRSRPANGCKSTDSDPASERTPSGNPPRLSGHVDAATSSRQKTHRRHSEPWPLGQPAKDPLGRVARWQRQ